MLGHTSSDVRVAACDAFSCIGKHTENISDQLLKESIPALLLLVKDKNTAVKASAEQALIDLLQLQQSQSVYHVRLYHLCIFRLLMLLLLLLLLPCSNSDLQLFSIVDYFFVILKP